ncbi:MAG: SDR family NAD(P)-dependent oxidoreductase [Deltaproteobacteria bacterium]|nr:SDR family NAD(P)-dependent oxidoreductase [Deltaproteobacteria bacterium]
MKSFRDKVAAVTGAGSGIGRALALELAAEGAHLSLSDINRESVDETAALVKSRGVRVTTARLDVADREAVHAWAARTVEDHGRANLIVNNAGVALAGSIEGASYEDFEWLMGINFWGVVHGTRAFLPHLRASGEGHVVNISSLFGILAVPSQGAYNASKFAVRGFTEALRQELDLSSNGTVSATCVHPGGIKTNIARSSRVSADLAAHLGAEPDALRRRFEKGFMTSPADAARTILRAVKRDSRRVLVGPDAVVLDAVARALPQGYQHLMELFARRMRA